MITYDDKSKRYLDGNPVVAGFLKEVDEAIAEFHRVNLPNLNPPPLRVEVGSRYIRIWSGTSCWGFISRVDGLLKGAPIRRGDLLKPASAKAPARGARGNITDGTARWGVYGPEYLK